jgi:hypothetical protein
MALEPLEDRKQREAAILRVLERKLPSENVRGMVASEAYEHVLEELDALRVAATLPGPEITLEHSVVERLFQDLELLSTNVSAPATQWVFKGGLTLTHTREGDVWTLGVEPTVG